MSLEMANEIHRLRTENEALRTENDRNLVRIDQMIEAGFIASEAMRPVSGAELLKCEAEVGLVEYRHARDFEREKMIQLAIADTLMNQARMAVHGAFKDSVLPSTYGPILAFQAAPHSKATIQIRFFMLRFK